MQAQGQAELQGISEEGLRSALAVLSGPQGQEALTAMRPQDARGLLYALRLHLAANKKRITAEIRPHPVGSPKKFAKWRGLGSSGRQNKRMVFAAQRLGGFGTADHTRHILVALLERADAEPTIQTRQPALLAPAASPLRLRARLGLNGEVSPRDLTVAIASCTRQEARRILDDLDQIAEQKGMSRGEAFESCADAEFLTNCQGSNAGAYRLLRHRAGEPNVGGDIDVSPAQARRMLERLERISPPHDGAALLRAGIINGLTPDNFAAFYIQRLQETAARDASVSHAHDTLSPRVAFDQLAERLRRGLRGKFLDYHAGADLARIAEPLADEDPEIRALFVASGLNLFMIPSMQCWLRELHPTRLRERLGISQPDQSVESLMERIVGISHDDALGLLRILAPLERNSNFFHFFGMIVIQLIDRSISEGIRFTDNPSRSNTSLMAATGRRVFRSLLNAVGFPDLSNMNPEGVRSTLQSLSYDVVDVLSDIVEDRRRFKPMEENFADIFGTEHVDDVLAVLNAADRMPSLQQRVINSLSISVAWQQLVTRMNRPDLADAYNNPRARFELAVDIANATTDRDVDMLTRKVRLDGMVRTVSPWAKLCGILKRPDLFLQPNDEAARRELAACILAYGQSNVRQLTHETGLNELWDLDKCSATGRAVVCAGDAKGARPVASLAWRSTRALNDLNPTNS